MECCPRSGINSKVESKKVDGTIEVVCIFPTNKRKVREGRVPDADDKLHPAPVKGGEVHKQSGLEGPLPADLVGKGKRVGGIRHLWC